MEDGGRMRDGAQDGARNGIWNGESHVGLKHGINRDVPGMMGYVWGQ